MEKPCSNRGNFGDDIIEPSLEEGQVQKDVTGDKDSIEIRCHILL